MFLFHAQIQRRDPQEINAELDNLAKATGEKIQQAIDAVRRIKVETRGTAEEGKSQQVEQMLILRQRMNVRLDELSAKKGEEAGFAVTQIQAALIDFKGVIEEQRAQKAIDKLLPFVRTPNFALKDSKKEDEKPEEKSIFSQPPKFDMINFAASDVSRIRAAQVGEPKKSEKLSKKLERIADKVYGKVNKWEQKIAKAINDVKELQKKKIKEYMKNHQMSITEYELGKKGGINLPTIRVPEISEAKPQVTPPAFAGFSNIKMPNKRTPVLRQAPTTRIEEGVESIKQETAYMQRSLDIVQGIIEQKFGNKIEPGKQNTQSTQEKKPEIKPLTESPLNLGLPQGQFSLPVRVVTATADTLKTGLENTANELKNTATDPVEVSKIDVAKNIALVNLDDMKQNPTKYADVNTLTGTNSEIIGNFNASVLGVSKDNKVDYETELKLENLTLKTAAVNLVVSHIATHGRTQEETKNLISEIVEMDDPKEIQKRLASMGFSHESLERSLTKIRTATKKKRISNAVLARISFEMLWKSDLRLKHELSQQEQEKIGTLAVASSIVGLGYEKSGINKEEKTKQEIAKSDEENRMRDRVIGEYVASLKAIIEANPNTPIDFDGHERYLGDMASDGKLIRQAVYLSDELGKGSFADGAGGRIAIREIPRGELVASFADAIKNKGQLA